MASELLTRYRQLAVLESEQTRKCDAGLITREVLADTRERLRTLDRQIRTLLTL